MTPDAIEQTRLLQAILSTLQQLTASAAPLTRRKRTRYRPALVAHEPILRAVCDEFGVTEADLPRIVAGARGSSMRGNPVELTDEHLEDILLEAL